MKEEIISEPRSAEKLYQKYQELYPEQFLHDTKGNIPIIRSPLVALEAMDTYS